MKKSKKPISQYRQVIVLSFVGSASAALVVAIGLASPIVGLAVFAVCFGFMLTLALSIWVNTIIHELGHVLAGLAVGYSFSAVQVDAFQLTKTSSGLKIRRSPDPSRPGLAFMHLPDSVPDVRKHRVFVWGGPAASFATLAIALILIRVFPLQPGASSITTFCFIAGCWFAVCAALCLTSLIPMTVRGFPSDGKQLLMLHKDTPVARRMLADIFISRQVLEGLLARHWSPVMMQALGEATDDSPEEVRARYLRYYWLTDQGDIPGGWAELERAYYLCGKLGNKVGFFNDMVQSERIFAAAWHLREPALAADLPRLTEIYGQDTLAAIALRADFAKARAATSLLAGSNEEAIRCIVEARQALNELAARYGGKSTTDLLWLAGMEREASHPGVGDSPTPGCERATRLER